MSYFEGGSSTNFGAGSPGGEFSPRIFSQKVLMFFRTASVVEGITNNDYFGEISGFGDTVRIIKEPVLSITPYTRGLTTSSEALDDIETTLEISKANYFQFQVDDIEEKLSHVNWQSLAQSSATYALKNSYDQEVLQYIATACQDDNIVDLNGATGHDDAQDDGNVITLGFGSGETDPLNVLSLMALKLDEADIPEEGRWVVVSPRFMELLSQTESILLSSDFNQGEGGLKNGLVMNGKLRGFSVYKTNNCPKFTEDDTPAAPDTADGDNVIGGGSDSGTALGGDVIIAGHMSAVATASAIDKAEVIRSENTFADIVRGLHVYGRGVLYPEALSVAYCVYA